MDFGKLVKLDIFLILILVLSSLVIWPLFMRGYFSHHDDLQVMRIFEMRKCFSDLQIPCRWVPDMGYGNGYPLFNYYNPFPYYLGGLFSLLLGYIGAAKALYFIASIMGGIAMYYLGKELFGEKGGFVAAILYQFAPYKALDLYVRGALAESFAISIIPLIFFFCIKLTEDPQKKFFFGLTLSLAALFTSHNIMIIFFLPAVILFAFYWTLVGRYKILPVILSFILGFGLASFFIIPSFLEKDLVQIENLTRLDLDFRAHFVTLNQLFFDRSWGYGASSPGQDDTISFQIGWPHWWIVAFCLPVILINFKNRTSKYALLFFIVFIFSIFMTHIRSAFVWEQINILRFAQFPWRFLSVSIFAASLLGGYLVGIIGSRYQIYLMIIICLLTIFLNWQYFRPEKFYPGVGDRQKLSGIEWDKQQKAAILDYLPKGAIQPREVAPDNPYILNGKAEVSNFKNSSNKFTFNIKVFEDSIVEVPVLDFPNWQIQANTQIIPHTKGTIGRMSFNLNQGDYLIRGEFKNTFIRSLANLISLVSLIVMASIIFYGKSRKIFS